MLIVVRHGRTPANAAGELLGRSDPPLDAVGAEQARAIGRTLAGVDRVLTSPLRRCRETAAEFGSPAEIDERLIEIDYGSLEGTATADVSAETWHRWDTDPTWAPPGGETHGQVADRVASLLDEIVEASIEQDIALITHVTPIKASLAWVLDVSILVAARCFVEQASITRIDASRRHPALRSFNDTAHLDLRP